MEHPPPADQLDAAQVLSLEPDEIESVQTGARLAVAGEEPMKVRQALEAVRDRLAVDHGALEGEGAHGLGDRHELGRPVAPVAGPQAHAIAVLAREEAIAVVLQLVQPAITGRHGLARIGWHGTMKPGGLRRFGRAQRVGVRINIKALYRRANGRSR